ncbi:MAG: polyphenol oxidase family protein, partial [Treponema sp.]|nr:polyphenol oxidase family protein [Treponema sp.]
MRAPAVSAGLFPFNLEFSGNPPAARFPFIFDGRPVETLPGGRPAPRCAVSGRAAGDMRYDPALPSERREAFFRSLGIDKSCLYSLVQVHSRTVFTLGSPAGESSAGRSARQSARLPPPEVFSREGDGMVSFAPSPCLAVTAADCLPVFLLDTQSGALAVLHSGWRG